MVWCIALASAPALAGCSALSKHDDAFPFGGAPWDAKRPTPARAVLGPPTVSTAKSPSAWSTGTATTQTSSFAEAMTPIQEVDKQPAKEPAKDQASEPAKKEPKEPAKEEKASEDEEPDQKPAIKVRGRINADAAIVNQSTRNRQIIGALQDATGFQRARLGAQGYIGEQVNWVAEWDFAGGNISFKDVYIGVDELPVVRRVRVGHLEEPFSLEGSESYNYFPFIVRSPVMALDPAYNWGIEILSYTEEERATLQAGAFRSGTSNSSGDDFGSQNDMAYDVRVTALPWYESEGRYLLHVGAAFSQRFPHDNTVTINQGPQNTLLPISENPGSPFLPTITILAGQQQLYNLQTAAVFGPLSLQAEWTGTHMVQQAGGPVTLGGGYVFASYFLTGENREYLRKDGTFGMTKVRSPFLWMKGKPFWGHGPGAWELLARFAYVDFANSNIPLQNGLKVGDKDAELTVGVNWYLNDYARLMFNYVHAVAVDPNFGPSWADAFFLQAALFW